MVETDIEGDLQSYKVSTYNFLSLNFNSSQHLSYKG